MNETAQAGLLAIDVGSSRVKLGWYPSATACTSSSKPSPLPLAPSPLREPAESLAVLHVGATEEDFDRPIIRWLESLGIGPAESFLASVHPAGTARLLEVFDRLGIPRPRVLVAQDLAIELRVDQPDSVGIDRLLAAVAANRLREPQRPAMVVGLGTATTVNLIAADGAFEGGAILPGIAMSARALHEGTASLPNILEQAADAPPSVVGKSTRDAIVAGLHWGAVGAINELVARTSQGLGQPAQLFATGGEAPRVVPFLVGPEGPARHVPHLVLAGICLAAEKLS